jgi:hypothetical protein
VRRSKDNKHGPVELSIATPRVTYSHSAVSMLLLHWIILRSSEAGAEVEIDTIVVRLISLVSATWLSHPGTFLIALR